MASDAPSAADLEAGRLLLGKTYAQLAREAQLHPDVVRNVTGSGAARRASPAVTATVMRVLKLNGIIFVGPELVHHRDGRIAPTRKAVGLLKGRRLLRARNALGYDPIEVASQAGVSTDTVRRLERLGALPLNASVYAVVGALQLMGYRFAPNHGDRALIARRRRNLQAWERDLPLHYIGVKILPQDMDDDL